MPGMKPSEKFSIVPEGLRKRFREPMYEDAPKSLRERMNEDVPKNLREPMYEDAPKSMSPSSPQGGPSMSDREVLKRMIEEEKMDMKEDRMEGEGMAMGGMVKKYAKGGMVKVRGYGKARSKPCKIC